MTTPHDIDRTLRQAATVASAVAEWIEEHSGANRHLGRLSGERIASSALRLQRLSQAATRRPGLAVIGGDAALSTKILMALWGQTDGLVAPGGGETRLPAANGLLPPGDRKGASVVIRYASEAKEPAAGTNAVGRMLSPANSRAHRATATGVRIDLLSYADLITIFGRAYLGHVRSSLRAPMRAALAAALDEERAAEPSAAMEPGLTRDDVDDIRLRLERAFAGHPHLEALAASDFWATYAALAPRASRASRRRLASFVWGGLADFDVYFARLSETIETLNHASEILCASDAVSQSVDGVLDTVHPVTVLAAATMLDSASDEALPAIEVRTRHGGAVQIARAVVAAIASEITVRPDTSATGRTRDHDILHVPVPAVTVPPRIAGDGRSSGQAATATPRGRWLAAAILEAKAVHLAERLVDRREIDAMVALVAPDAPLPVAIAPALSRWVEHAAGPTPRDRDGNGDVFVLAAVADPVAPGSDASPVWSSLDRFRATFAPECGWLDEWGQGTAFDRIVLLGPRGAAGKTQRGNELVTASRAVARMSTADEAARVPLDRKRLRRATLTLEEALAAEDGGLRYLVQTVGGMNLKRLRRRQLAREAYEVSRLLGRSLRRCYLTGQSDADNDWRRRATLEAQAWLRGHARAGHVGPLIYALLPSEPSVSARIAAAFEGSSADIEAAGADEMARRAATRAVTAWLDGLLVWSASDASATLIAGATPDLEHLVDELALSAIRVDLAGRIAQAAARILTIGSPRPELLLARIAREATEIIARHVAELGFDAAWSARHPRRPGALGAPLFDRAVGAGLGSEVSVASRMADQYADDWCEAFPILVEENIAAARIVRMDERDLRQLAELADQLETIGRRSVT